MFIRKARTVNTSTANVMQRTRCQQECKMSNFINSWASLKHLNVYTYTSRSTDRYLPTLKRRLSLGRVPAAWLRVANTRSSTLPTSSKQHSAVEELEAHTTAAEGAGQDSMGCVPFVTHSESSKPGWQETGLREGGEERKLKVSSRCQREKSKNTHFK